MTTKKLSNKLGFNNYLLSNDLGILGSSIYKIRQAVVPIVADNSPSQDNNAANMILYLLFSFICHINSMKPHMSCNCYMAIETSYILKDESSN